MDSDQLNRWLTLGANLAVLAGIAFLAYELRQNTIASQISAGNSLESSLREMELFIAGNEDFAEILEKGINGSEVTSTEQLRLTVFYRAVLRGWQNLHYQYQTGALDEAVWFGQQKAITRTFNDDSGLQSYWRANKGMYSDEFDELLDSMIAKPSE